MPFDPTLAEFQACCVVFQYNHYSVAPPQGVPLRCVLQIVEAHNLLECDECTLRWLTDGSL